MQPFRALPRGMSFAAQRQVAMLTFALVTVCALGQPLAAQLPVTRLYAIYPLGGKHGTTIDVTLTSGADLEGVDRLRFSHPGITAEQKMQKVEGQEEPQPIANQFTVTIAPDVPVGLYELRCAGRFGISNPRAFLVSDRDEISETEPNDAAGQATAVKLGTIVNGRSGQATDLDFFKFHAQAGQRVLIQAWAQRIDSRMDATLTLFDSTGRELAFNRDFNRRDPFLDFSVPADGEYLVEVHDFLYAGSNEYFYRLSIGTGPYIDYVFPPSGTPGTTQTFALFGRNLPGGQTAEEVTVEGRPLDRLDVEIDVPGDSASTRLESDSLIAPEDSAMDGFTYRLATAEGSSNPILIPFATAPIVAEQEPNDEPASAQSVSLPCEFVGQFQDPGDRDWLTFEAKKGQVFWVEAFSQRMGLPADPRLQIQRVAKNEDGSEKVSDLKTLDDYGTNIGGASYDTRSEDPVDRFAVPEDGTYRVVVRDLDYYTRGDPRLVYRLSLREEQPDFRLIALSPFPNDMGNTPNPWTALIRKGGTERIQVLAFRRDGFSGEIKLSAEQLPEGVACAGAVIGPGQNSAILVFTATEQASDWAGPIQITGTATIGEQEVTRAARGGAVLWAGAQNLEVGSRMARDVALAVGSETAPFLVETGVDSVALPQSHQLNIPVKVTRRGEFKSDMTLTAFGMPGNTQTNAVVLKGDASETTVPLFIQNNATPGTYTFYVQATTKVSYTKKADGSDKKDVDVVDGSTPITVTINPGPLTIAPKVADNGAVKQGAMIEVQVTLNRRNNFEGPVTLELVVPPEIKGITAEPVAVAAGEKQAKLVIKASDEATEGQHKFVALRANVEQDGKPVAVDQTITLNVQKKEEEKKEEEK